jgi:uncharacterized repeat protein (TIGR01451 family)
MNRFWHALAATSIAVSGILLSSPAPALAATPGSAEGDSYAVYGQAFAPVLGVGPVFVGPIAPARATVPPGVTQVASSGLVNYDACTNRNVVTGLCSSYQQALVEKVDVPGDNAKATIASASSTECAVPGPALPTGFNNGALTGGNACAHVAYAGLLNSPAAGLPVDFASVNGVDSQSTTQSCTATPAGRVNIAKLSVAGTDVVGGTSPLVTTNTPAPNTTVQILPAGVHLATVILNEQVYDSQGHGLTVNAVHIFTTGLAPIANADVIVGHAHSEAFCSDGSTTNSASAASQATVPTVTVTDSTKHANPGEDVSYAISIDNKGCAVTSVTDILPPGFHFLSASGPLGVPGVSSLPNGQQQLFWSNGGNPYPLTPNPMVETLSVAIDPNAPAGDAIDNVVGTSDCGSFAGSDLLGLNGATLAANNGDNPGIIVPRSATNGNAGNNGGAAPANQNLPATMPTTSGSAPVSPLAALLFALGGAALVASAAHLVRRLRTGW